MGLVDRVKNILVTPKSEWEVIAAENTPPKSVVTGYVLPLALVAAIAGFVSGALIGTSMPMLGGTFRMPILWAVVMAIYQVVMAVVMVFVLGFIIDTLAPSFGGQKNLHQAIKVAAYAYTPAWLGALLGIIPYVGWLLGLLFALYAFYLLYLGLPRLMRNPEDKSILYTVVVVVVAIVVAVIIGFVGTLITAPAMMGAASIGGTAPTVTYDKGSPMGKLDDFSRKMEEANKKMEEAQKSGDSKKQMEAAMGALGTAMSGGKGVDPVQIDALKPFVPATFAGLKQTSTQYDRSGVAGLMIAKAEAHYGDDSGKNVELEVVDTGGAAGLMGLASWVGAQGERENAERRESTRREGNRLVHEEVDKRGGHSKYTVVMRERFVVSAEGNGVDINALKSAVNSIDLGKLEALK